MPIAEDLEQKGLLYRAEQYRHRYPVCWRCNTDLVFRLVDEWFIAMDDLRQPMMDVTRQIDLASRASVSIASSTGWRTWTTG